MTSVCVEFEGFEDFESLMHLFRCSSDVEPDSSGVDSFGVDSSGVD